MHELSPGEHLDSFEIIENIHKGGMARLYKARDLFSGNIFVLKVPVDDIFNHPFLYYHHQNEEWVGRYLNHPRLIKFHYRFRSTMYLISEYIDGYDLRELLAQKKRLDPEAACNLIDQIAEGVQHLHSISILHLDLKPENILITRKGNVKILDFGLAHHRNHPDLLARDFTAPHGTPYYIAPEQICGIRNEPRSDQYSLAIMLYELLTSHLPFERSKHLSKVRQRLSREPVPPRYYTPALHPSLQDVVLTALGRLPGDRFSSVRTFRRALKDYKYTAATSRGRLTTKPLSIYSLFQFPSCTPLLKNAPPAISTKKKTSRHVLGCVMDGEQADRVVEYIKRDIIQHGGIATILSVIPDEYNLDLIKYTNEVAGKSFASRVENYLATLRHYQIQATLRIKTGVPHQVIIDTARELDADTVILGPPRPQPTLTKYLLGSIVEKVSQALPATIIIANPLSSPAQREGSSPRTMTQEMLLETDIYLIDIWIQHLNMLYTLPSEVVLDHAPPSPSENSCAFSGWIDQLTGQEDGPKIKELIHVHHHRFHHLLDQMHRLLLDEDQDGITHLYRAEAKKVCDNFKQGLQSISSYLKLQNIQQQ